MSRFVCPYDCHSESPVERRQCDTDMSYTKPHIPPLLYHSTQYCLVRCSMISDFFFYSAQQAAGQRISSKQEYIIQTRREPSTHPNTIICSVYAERTSNFFHRNRVLLLLLPWRPLVLWSSVRAPLSGEKQANKPCAPATLPTEMPTGYSELHA